MAADVNTKLFDDASRSPDEKVIDPSIEITSLSMIFPPDLLIVQLFNSAPEAVTSS